MYKIEKNIKQESVYGNTFPFSKMEIGDSFAVESANVAALRSAAQYYQGRKVPGTKFSVKKTDDGYRCWRIA